MPFAKPTYHKPEYVYQAEFLRLYDITYADIKDMMSGGQMNYEVDRHNRAWISIKEGERLGIARKDPPDLMPSAYKKLKKERREAVQLPLGFISMKERREKVKTEAAAKRKQTLREKDMNALVEIVKVVKALKAERDDLRKQLKDFNSAMSEIKKAI